MAAKETGQTGASSLPLSPPLLLYRVIDGTIRSREDRLKSLIDISKLDVDLLYQLVYSRREIPGIGVLATPAAETGGLGPTRIVDIAVIHQTDQADQAKALFDAELQASENRKRERMRSSGKASFPTSRRCTKMP